MAVGNFGRKEWLSIMIAMFMIPEYSDGLSMYTATPNRVSVYSNIRNACSCMKSIARSRNTEETQSPSLSKIAEVDALYSSHRVLRYDASEDRFLPMLEESTTRRRKSMQTYLKAAFVPESVNSSYYRYMRWRIVQRFLSAVVHVFGTQSLLLGLGLRNHKNLGLSAAFSWVLKDALGKIIRMIWASKMGRKFDPDAKRWRFRSSLLFALGNLLEICTYIHPPLFLVYATVANSLKQMSMLASSATRNALYNSFKPADRENIGDITAKGEAQIAVVDLLGIATGVALSKSMGIQVPRVLTVYFLLQTLEIMAMYKEIRSVIFSVLNFERLYHCVHAFVRQSMRSPSLSLSHLAECIPTPTQMAKREKVFLPPKHLERRAIAFGSFGRARLNPVELHELQRIFAKEKFLLVVGQNIKSKPNGGKSISVEENCHIVLHAQANNADIVKSTLALTILRSELLSQYPNYTVGASSLRTSDCYHILNQTRQETDVLFPRLLRVLQMRGWATPAKNMFGSSSMRAEWDILSIAKNNTDISSIQVSMPISITTTTSNAADSLSFQNTSRYSIVNNKTHKI